MTELAEDLKHKRNDPMKVLRFLVGLQLVWLPSCGGDGAVHDLLLLGGSVLDGSGAPAVVADVAVSGERISFVGDAAAAGVTASDTVDVSGLTVTPGLVDMHSHAELDSDHGRDASPRPLIREPSLPQSVVDSSAGASPKP